MAFQVFRAHDKRDMWLTLKTENEVIFVKVGHRNLVWLEVTWSAKGHALIEFQKSKPNEN